MIADGLLADIAGVIGTIDESSLEPVHGGSINQAFSLRTDTGARYFLKTNRADASDMFAAEFAGLAELASARCIRVPQPIAYGTADGRSWLLLECLLLGPRTEQAEARLGTLLARQHRHCARRFGWSRNNTIGSTLQRNDRSDDWVGFFAHRRLGFQLRLAADNGWGATLAVGEAELRHAVARFFVDYQPEASLLHGDLWGGNWGATDDGEPVIFDPAVYFGDRETDLAMTRLFGGFGSSFYTAYNDEWPLDSGFQRRCDLYNLYHVLNHLNLFGQGYLAQAEALLSRLLNET